jgi:diaminohydroxyphosphoribosylaminopyrimidine deaminase/5-amino-6-(5-phosphoribosylamino)uracil reductase
MIQKNREYISKLVFNLSKLHSGFTGLNPSVGCVVTSNKKIISYGVTGINGSPHAENHALKKIKKLKIKKNLYLSLEPCHHTGKNPPCTKIIKKSNIKNLFYYSKDLNPLVNQKGLNFLEQNKINVKYLKNKNFDSIIEVHNQYYKLKKPIVSGKIAVTKKNFTKNIDHKYITNTYSRKFAHILRANHQALLVGVNTINDDNPFLNCRIRGLESLSPALFIIDPKLRIKKNSNVLRSSVKVFVIYSKKNKNKINYLKTKKVTLINLSTIKKNFFDIKTIIKLISYLGYKNILVEGGNKLLNIFFNNCLFNNFYFFKSNESKYKKNLLKFNYNKFISLKKINKFINLSGDTLLIFKKKNNHVFWNYN